MGLEILARQGVYRPTESQGQDHGEGEGADGQAATQADEDEDQGGAGVGPVDEGVQSLERVGEILQHVLYREGHFDQAHVLLAQLPYAPLLLHLQVRVDMISGRSCWDDRLSPSLLHLSSP